MRVLGSTEAERLLQMSLPAAPASCPQARHHVTAAVQGLGVDVAAVELAVSEAVSNVVLHAYRDREEVTEDGRIHLRVTANADGVWVLVADDGVGMSARDDSPGLGLGLRVIASASDELSITQGEPGTRVHMRFALSQPRVEGPR
jgi:serine/threonine-protein kinase RsbW